jgi:SSS family solute:Na+ symporter
VATVVVGLIGVGTALALIGVKSILDAWWLLQGVFAGGLLGLFLLGIISRRAGSGAAAAAVLLGVLVIAWMTFTPLIDAMPPFLRSPLHANMVIVIGTLTIFLAGLALSRVMNGRSPSRSQERRK